MLTVTKSLYHMVHMKWAISYRLYDNVHMVLGKYLGHLRVKWILGLRPIFWWQLDVQRYDLCWSFAWWKRCVSGLASKNSPFVSATHYFLRVAPINFSSLTFWSQKGWLGWSISPNCASWRNPNRMAYWCCQFWCWMCSTRSWWCILFSWILLKMDCWHC